jgi:tetratricopeptide (TPR) repeat protein
MRASIHYVYEEFEDALALDLKSIEILKKHYPEEHADIGTACNSAAREYYSLCKFDVALDYYFRAKCIYETVYGEYDSDTAAVCGNISKTYVAMGDYKNALEWCLKTLDIQKETLREKHPETVLRHSFATEIYEALGLYEKSNDHLQIILRYYQDAGVESIARIVCERLVNNYKKLNNQAESSKYQEILDSTLNVGR